MPTPQEARDEALERVEENAHADWLMAAEWAVTGLAFNYEEFTSDDIWKAVNEQGFSTHEPRAMGAVMVKAARAGMIAPTDRWVQSKRTACHGRPIRVWRSLLSDVKQAA
jgi:hypothetical protein